MKKSQTIRLTPLLLWGLVAVFLASTNAFAQTTKVSGTIINQRTAAPATGATITVKNTNRSSVADDAGRFTIEASPDDVLVISSVGFTSQEVKVSSGLLRVQLHEADNQMDNVVV